MLTVLVLISNRFHSRIIAVRPAGISSMKERLTPSRGENDSLPECESLCNSLEIITQHKTGRNPTQELKTSFVTVRWIKCSLQNIISSFT